ncbi:syndetin-like [Littorina saxatilis]|uniref:syndetin-like n=1 Tax=Littorina saxatilis TaxID=31220 RepID=UPI0038B5245D
MDLKHKLKSLIGKQEPVHSPVEENIHVTDLLTSAGAAAVSKVKHPTRLRNPHEEQDVLDSIEPAYLKDETCDTSLFELEKLPEIVDTDKLTDDRTKLGRQLQVVSKRVSELILQNHPAYAVELERVMELQRTLQSASSVCLKGRRQLQHARSSFTIASLGLLANYKKRQQLMGLLKSLHTIKTLQRTDLRLRELMEEEDYSGAIQLCLECQKAASTFRHYKCISELSSKLQDTLEMIEEQLDVALSKTCSGFDVTHYEKVQNAYRLLGKTQTAMDQLHMHFASAIHNTAFTIVLGYVELCSGASGSNFQKRQYTDLCKHITIESFTPCLLDLCKALWGVMRSYYQTMQWHEAHDHDSAEQPGQFKGAVVEATFNRRYVMQKLEYGRGRVWQDVQQKVKTYVLAIDLSHFKLEEFIHVLDLINRMIKIGEEFCGSKSEGLQDSLKQQSLNYFKNHHRARLDELRMFLENEAWELCPVKSNFNTLQLMEFRFMRNLRNKGQVSTLANSSPDSEGKLTLDASEGEGQGYFQRYAEGSPFEGQQEEEENEDVFSGTGDLEDGYGDSDSDSDIPDELKQDYIDELTGETHSYKGTGRHSSSSSGRSRFHRSSSRSPGPIITMTTLNVLRVVGKYLQMVSVLQPIAFDVISCMSQLFDYYLYTVFCFFATDRISPEDRSINNRLLTTLKRIHDNLIADPGVTMEGDGMRDRVPTATLLSVVDVTSPATLYGLAERTVAVESLVFLASQLEMLEAHLEALIPPNRKAFLQTFYTQTVKMATELRKPVYRPVASRAISYEHVLQQMNNVRWDIKEIMSQHNSYVDTLLRSLTELKVKLREVDRRIPLPQEAVNTVWEHCIRGCNRTIVEGYSHAKKCSNEGRALMQLDYQQFLTKLDQIVVLKPIPEKELVEAYIKAYYLPDAQLETWVHEHKEYSNKQLLALINSVDHLSRKSRQRIIATIEEAEKTGKR